MPKKRNRPDRQANDPDDPVSSSPRMQKEEIPKKEGRK
jgi:hypothetical protein